MIILYAIFALAVIVALWASGKEIHALQKHNARLEAENRALRDENNDTHRCIFDDLAEDAAREEEARFARMMA